MNIHLMPLPHHSSRKDHKITALVLHYPAPNMDFEKPYSVEALHALLLKEGLSYHYYVTKEGEVYNFVSDSRKAWHAGDSILHGESNVNFFSIGVCLENNGGEEYPETQIYKTARLCHSLSVNYRIPPNRIIGHCHVSPGRKIDPGPKFPWYAFFLLLN